MAEDGKPEIGRRRSKLRSDRISELPEEIILEILSRLSILEAIPTSLLSRGWKNLWKRTDALDFSLHCCEFQKSNPMRFVERALSLHEASKIKRFCARCRYDSGGAAAVDSWVSFAISRGVEELVLDLFGAHRSVRPHALPRSIYQCGSLTQLDVNLCGFRPQPSFCLPSLQKLAIKNSELAGDELRDLTVGCPKLEELTLVNCNPARDLDVVILNRKLRALRIVEFFGEAAEEGTEVRIRAPHLCHLELQFGDLRPCRIDAPSLISAFVDVRRMDASQSLSRILKDAIAGLREVRMLRLSSWCVQAMHSCLQTPFMHLKDLKLEVRLGKHELPGIGCLLRRSPELERLIIRRPALMAKANNSSRNKADSGRDKESCFDCLQESLKEVLVENFRGEEDEIRFLEDLFRNSPALKNVVLLVPPASFTGSGEAYVEYCGKAGKVSGEYLNSIRMLMMCPRSPQAEITFSGRQPTWI